MRQLKTIVVLLLVIVALTAAYQNITPIKGKSITLGLDLYVHSWQTRPIPLGFVIVLCFLGGAAVMALVDFPMAFRLRKRARRLEKELARYGHSDVSHAHEDLADPDEETPEGSKGS